MNIYKWEHFGSYNHIVVILANSLEEALSLLEPYHAALYEDPDEVYSLKEPVVIVDAEWDYEENWGEDL